MANDNTNFAHGAMSKEEHENVSRKGGESQGKENNPANFANDKAKAKRAGHEGGSK